MIRHTSLGKDFAAKRKLKCLISSGEIRLAGNKKLRIYGSLSCYSGKRMKTDNRVFFANEDEAIEWGYRPCKNCRSKQDSETTNEQ